MTYLKLIWNLPGASELNDTWNYQQTESSLVKVLACHQLQPLVIICTNLLSVGH